MISTKGTQPGPTKPIEPKLSRSQRRLNDRVNNTYSELADKFMNSFMASDNPEGQEIIDLMDRLSRKWRVYCKQVNLKSEAFSVLDSYMSSVIKDYLDMRVKP